MEELLKKINGNLIEIKSKQNKDTFHISGGEGNIGQLNNILIHNQSNLISQNLNIILKYNLNGKLINENKLLVDLLSIDNFNFSFKVISEDIYSNFYEDKHWEKTCLDLKNMYSYPLKKILGMKKKYINL